MLAQIVLIQQLLLHGRKAGIEHQGVQRHKGTFLQHGCVVDGIQGIPAPGKGPVTVNQCGGNPGGGNLPAAEGLDDDIARLQLIFRVQGISP